MLYSRSTVALLAATACSPASAQFLTPPNRGDINTIYAEWDFFSSPAGPNLPDQGVLFGGLVPGDPSEFNVYDGNFPASGAFVTSTLNLYAVEAQGFPGDGRLEPVIEFPSFGQGYGFLTEVTVQIRTVGTIPDDDSFVLNVQTPTFDQVELARFDLGPDGIGGGTELFKAHLFQAPRDRAVNAVEFEPLVPSMSLTRVVLDVTVTPMACPVDLNLDSDVNFADLLVLLRDADLGRSDVGDPALGDGDWNGDSELTPADFEEFLAELAAGCAGF